MLRSIAAALPFVLAGCAVGPIPERPEVALTANYHAVAVISPQRDRWWAAFGDPVLTGLVEAAVEQNLDVAAAAARVDQARAAARAAGAFLLPQVDLVGSAEHNRQSLRTPVGAVAGQLGLPRSYSLYQFGPQASWELDLFGGRRLSREAARADVSSAEADEGAVRLSIAAETADAYLQLRGLQARLDVATRQLETERRLVDLVRQQAAEGIVAERELNRVVGESRGIEASLAPLRAAVAGQGNRLDVLTGHQAGMDAAATRAVAVIPQAADPSGSSFPAELMRRRPDIVAAERRLAAASARVGVATAEYYPHVSLSGLFGLATLGGSRLFSGDALQAGGGIGLRWRLFDFGRVAAEVAGAEGRRSEALARFRGDVLRATEEVETALTRLVEERTEVALRSEQVASLTLARDQARLAYKGGVLGLVEVLDADRALLDASDRLAVARTDAARASVAATRALGGGWNAGT